ncbi:hypothetical protein HYC85_004731 [Camellia sinensis]|uniref:Poly [ADP-ribose] polymerase n=1 Tax=Camellia sinensis TaxID=4442 RepID=A0A7J7HZA8_CAMSI|nr:hypothetical protein HYC85_004731 [Camellia sinensis]
MEADSSRHQCRLFSVPLETTNGYVNGFRDLASNNIEFKLSGSEDHDHDQDQDQSISDCESGISGPNIEQSQLFGDGLIKVPEDDKLHEFINRKFISGLGSLGMHTSVDKLGFNRFMFLPAQWRRSAVGNANLRYAWYGASKDEIGKIITHGFGHCGGAGNNGLYGCGIYLSPDDSSIDRLVYRELSGNYRALQEEILKSSIVDEDGLRHVLLCRVILGNTELVHPGSEQFHPSSEQFDSGVDNLVSPKKYIVWSTHVNTHILLEYIISFRVTYPSTGWHRIPTSPWMPFSTLISVLSKFLPTHAISLISKYHAHHRVSNNPRHLWQCK